MNSRIVLSAGALATSALLVLSTGVLADSTGHGGNNGAGAGRDSAAPVGTTDLHNGNRGDVWMEEGTGEAIPAKGHENDTHLACNAPLNVMGDKMGDSGGYFSIVPQGGNGGPSTYNGTWSYAAKGGIQVIARVPAGALQAGHYKLDLTQDPQKHKVFWIDDCVTTGGTGAATGTGTGTATGTGSGTSAASGTTESLTVNGETVTVTLINGLTMAEFDRVEMELSKLAVGQSETVESITITRTSVNTFTAMLGASSSAAPAAAAPASTTSAGSTAPAVATAPAQAPTRSASNVPASGGGVLAETASLPLIGSALGATGAVLAETGTPLGFLILGIVLIVVGVALFTRRRRSVL